MQRFTDTENATDALNATKTALIGQDGQTPAPTDNKPATADGAIMAWLCERYKRAMQDNPRWPYAPTPATPAITAWLAEWRSTRENPVWLRGPRQGLALWGMKGTGKTTAAHCHADLTGSRVLRCTHLDEIFAKYGDAGIAELLGDVRECDVWIDDLGVEGQSKHFGAAIDMDSVIMRRYDLWQRNRRYTHFTSNLTRPERQARYKDRIIDRMDEMCAAVPCAWPSFRTSGGAK